MANKPYLKIIEQPEKSCRFRYESEKGRRSSIFGENSTVEKQSYPTIEIGNCTGTVEIRISCVTNNDRAPKIFRQHPHKLSSKDVSNNGSVLLKPINVEQMKRIEIKNVGIVFMKQQRIQDSLTVRKNDNIDPTNGGWDHILRPRSIDLHCVRLCFEAFLYRSNGIREPLGYVISNPIINKKFKSSLKIVKMSSHRSPVSGGKEIIMLCDKVEHEDISVLFYEEDANHKIIWKEEFKESNSENYAENFMKVHHHCAIIFKTPKYWEFDIQESRTVFVQLIRPSDNKSSEPVPFEFVPNPQSQIRRKKQRSVNESVKKLSYHGCAAPLKKEEKSNGAQTIKGEHILTEANRNVTMERTPNPQPLITLADEDKGNVGLHLSNQVQNAFQASRQHYYQQQTVNTNPFESQYNFPYGTYSNTNYPSYYYTPYAQQQSVDSHFCKPSNAQVSYNLQPTLLPNPTNMYLQQQSTENLYPCGQNRGEYMNPSAGSYSMNSAINCIPSTSNNDNNKAVKYPVNSTQITNDNLEGISTNLSDLALGINTSELMKFIENDININEMDVIVKSVEKICL